MGATSEQQYFLTVNIWLRHSLALLLMLLARSPASACGPYYDSLRMDMQVDLGFEPRTPALSDGQFLWGQMANRHISPAPAPWRDSRAESAKFIEHLNKAFTAAGRGLLVRGTRPEQAPDVDPASIKLVDVPFPGHGYDWGNCRSNTLDSYLIFVEAVISDAGINNDEMLRLVGLRNKLFDVCGNQIQLNGFVASLDAASENMYEIYLQAAGYFYLGQYSEALHRFERLAVYERHPLGEVSLYLIARTLLLKHQPEEEYSEFSDAEDERLIARAGLDEAEEAFRKYLAAYPAGRYAESARGLVRRTQWLAGDEERYGKELEDYIDTYMRGILARGIWSEEEHNKIYALFTEHERYIGRDHNADGFQSLKLMLRHVDVTNRSASKEYTNLIDMKKFIDLYHQFQLGNYELVISSLQISHSYHLPEFLLLVSALEDGGQWQKAYMLWDEVRERESRSYKLWEVANYEMAKILVGQQGVEGLLFRDDFNPSVEWRLEETNRIKTNYLASLCGTEEQLSWIADETISMNSRQAILADIATRYLYSENFTDLHAVFSEYPDEVLGVFSSIRTAVRQAAEGQDLGKAYMNIGFFMQNHIQPLYVLPGLLQEPPGEYGNSNSRPDCSQATISSLGAAGPYYYYNLASTYFGEEKSADEAKSLHFITLCFKVGAAYEGACLWGKNVPNSVVGGLGSVMTSEQAFKKLHGKYGGSEWARKTPYYY